MRALPGVLRGCGRRVEGGVYAECGVGPYGKPLEYFLVDPAIPMTLDHKIGIELVEGRDGLTHILDWVGETHYPYVTDLLEEGRHFGFSRRIPKTANLRALAPGSRLLLVHAKGRVTNGDGLRPFADQRYHTPDRGGLRKQAFEHHCGQLERTGTREHYAPGTPSCSRDLWMIAPPTDVRAYRSGAASTRTLGEDGSTVGDAVCYLRVHASVSYRVYPVTPDAPRPEFAPALVASLPITHLSVIRARDGSHQETLQAVRDMLAAGNEGELKINVTESDA